MLMAIVFESRETDAKDDIIDKVHMLWTQIYRTVGLRIGLSTESLRFAATLYGASAPSRPLGEEDAVDLLHSRAKSGPDAVIEVTTWLNQVTEAVDRVRRAPRLNAVTDIQQARLVATAIYLNKSLGSEDIERILRRWEKVTFRIYGMFAKDARTAVGDYTRLAWRIAKGGYSPSKILDELAQIGRHYPIQEAVEQLREFQLLREAGGGRDKVLLPPV